MKNLIWISLAFMFLFSCNKERDSQTITGRIMRDCYSNPMANEEFVLFNQGNRSFTGSRFKVPFTTDASGNFCVTYTDGFWSSITVIRYRGEEFFAPLDYGNAGTIIYKPSINLQVNLKINNSYSQGDTLRVLENNREIYKFPFPFSDTVLDTIKNHHGYSQYAEINGMETKQKVLLGLSYRVDSGQIRTPSFKIKKQDDFDNNIEKFDGCVGDKVYQVDLIVD